MKNITLKTYGVGVYEDPAPFVLDEDLQLTFIGCTAANGEYASVVKCNGEEKTIKLVDGAITVPLPMLSAGELYISVALYIRGKKITEWTVDPLTLTPVTVGFEAVSTVAALKAENADLKSALTACREELSGYVKAAQTAEKTANTAVQTVQENALAAAKYIYRHYQKDLRDNEKDFSAKEFLSLLGFEFTDEELKAVEKFIEEVL